MKPGSYFKTISVLSSIALFMYSCNNSANGYAVTDTTYFDSTRLWVGWNKYHIPEHDNQWYELPELSFRWWHSALGK